MDLDEKSARADVTERLRKRFPTVEEDRLAKAVDDSYRELDDAKIRSFIGILVEKQARELLEH
ncbi:MAG: hypothetical protein JWO46_2223 [Nocardioidaceae bacterium]|nr:hypothetical protein [Nocardioidaceae bacterium]